LKHRQPLFDLDTSAVVTVPGVCAMPTAAERGGAWENWINGPKIQIEAAAIE
jgi:hypothetical protein